jgi:two-component system, chemotaxis family, sensor kinase CheA
VIGVMLLILMIAMGMSREQNERMNELVQDRYEKIKMANVIRTEIGKIGRELNELAYSQDGVIDIENIKDIEKSYPKINNSIDSLKQVIKVKEAKESLLVTSEKFQEYKAVVNSIITLDSEVREKGLQQSLQLAEQKREQLITSIENLISIQETIMDETIKETEDMYVRTLQIIIITTILGVVLGLGLALFVIRTISTRLNRVKNVMKQIEYGTETYPKIDIIHKDEVGEISLAFNEMSSALEQHEKIERELMESMERENWLKSRLSELSTMSQGSLDSEELGTKFIYSISRMVEANYAMLYTKGKKENQLSKLASYAFVDEGIGRDRITIGEGLVGQCALDGQPILMEQVPDNYIKIASGLGETNPSAIFILPILIEGELVGVMELAKLTSFTPEQLSLIEQAAVQLGITLNRIEKHMQIQELLEESQTLNEELQTQSEELQTQQEELRTMNDELEAQYHSSEQKTKELEKIQSELVTKNEEVIQSSKYKSEFLANMSHELRTPLNSLIILAQMLKENKEGNLDEKQIEYAKTIHSSGNDLLNLINDILDLSKIESGKMELHQGEVVVNDILSYTERQFTPVAKKKDLEFSVSVSDDVPSILYTDEQRLYQIIKNLLSNAFKFTEKGSVQLVVGIASNGHKEGTAFTDHIMFSVIDSGIGINQTKHAIVFDAFRQADGTTSRKYGGTGLGLSISRELARMLYGFIEVDSVEGEGSTFTLYLPMTEIAIEENLYFTQEVAGSIEKTEEKPAQDLQLYSKQEEVNSLAGKKIMVVDDDMRNIFALTSALEGAEMNVVFSENGKEAIDMLVSQPDIDLVLMDIMMPEMDGYEAMQNIRSMQPYESLPIIALTAKAMMHDRQKCIDAGASDYISKPVNLEQLFSLLKVWLHK